MKCSPLKSRINVLLPFHAPYFHLWTEQQYGARFQKGFLIGKQTCHASFGQVDVLLDLHALITSVSWQIAAAVQLDYVQARLGVINFETTPSISHRCSSDPVLRHVQTFVTFYYSVYFPISASYCKGRTHDIEERYGYNELTKKASALYKVQTLLQASKNRNVSAS